MNNRAAAAGPHWYLTTIETARIAKISSRTLERLRASGGGPKWTTAGRAVRYRTDWIDEWMEARARGVQDIESDPINKNAAGAMSVAPSGEANQIDGSVVLHNSPEVNVGAAIANNSGDGDHECKSAQT